MGDSILTVAIFFCARAGSGCAVRIGFGGISSGAIGFGGIGSGAIGFGAGRFCRFANTGKPAGPAAEWMEHHTGRPAPDSWGSSIEYRGQSLAAVTGSHQQRPEYAVHTTDRHKN